MNSTHLHLLVNHIPLFFCFIGLCILIYSLYTNGMEARTIGLSILVIAGLGAFASYYSGEPAEILIKNYPDISMVAMKKHEDLAKISLIGMSILSAFSLLLLIILQRMKSFAWARFSIQLIIGLSLAEFILIANVGRLGGKIRHEEIREQGEE